MNLETLETKYLNLIEKDPTNPKAGAYFEILEDLKTLSEPPSKRPPQTEPPKGRFSKYLKTFSKHTFELAGNIFVLNNSEHLFNEDKLEIEIRNLTTNTPHKAFLNNISKIQSLGNFRTMFQAAFRTMLKQDPFFKTNDSNKLKTVRKVFQRIAKEEYHISFQERCLEHDLKNIAEKEEKIQKLKTDLQQLKNTFRTKDIFEQFKDYERLEHVITGLGHEIDAYENFPATPYNIDLIHQLIHQQRTLEKKRNDTKPNLKNSFKTALENMENEIKSLKQEQANLKAADDNSKNFEMDSEIISLNLTKTKLKVRLEQLAK